MYMHDYLPASLAKGSLERITKKNYTNGIDSKYAPVTDAVIDSQN
jgi:hypothetical protein